ncbi:maleylpyruvate isomerase N-terminal domain-containing protein [Streptomyces olivochromogenes]|uniref:Mycothiol-dependent maleylpyruvate isomerase metal-binding domain-containing protein n=1 Tax=Streptomyces olivochromogenes TaxID=1963 RepID=A0A250VJ18_STROL|nr:maleylpyruvate isomerase N-terminal domain-containing protein [Streptomyces olivochromogenes]GAX53990.1 hypothetical protein SO3561_05522 [Streptomyces olivochromogenes]
MDQGRVVEAFRLEAGQLARAIAGVSVAEWGLPTRCAPWKVSDLPAHVRVVIAWLPGMVQFDSKVLIRFLRRTYTAVTPVAH